MTIRIEIGAPIAFRPTDYDADVLREIQAQNPHIPDAPGLLREALRLWQVVTAEEDQRLDNMREQLERIERKLDDFIEAHSPGK